MLYIKDIRTGSLVLSDLVDDVVLDARHVGQVISVLDQCADAMAGPGFTLVHNAPESNDAYDYTYSLDGEKGGLSAAEARVVKYALRAACLRLLRVGETT